MDVPRCSLWAVTSAPGESLSSGQPWMLVGRDVEQSASEVTVAGSSCLRLALALALVSRTSARLLPRPVSEVLPGAAVGTEGGGPLKGQRPWTEGQRALALGLTLALGQPWITGFPSQFQVSPSLPLSLSVEGFAVFVFILPRACWGRWLGFVAEFLPTTKYRSTWGIRAPAE